MNESNCSRVVASVFAAPLALSLIGGGIALAAIVWATYLDTFSTDRAAIYLLLLLISGTLLVTRRDALGFNFAAALFAFPLFGLIVPPARFGIFAWDYVAVINLILLMIKLGGRPRHVALVPVLAAGLGVLFFLPSVVGSVEQSLSLVEYGRLILYYAFFVVAYHYLQEPEWMNRFHILIACALIIVAVSIVLQKTTGVSFRIYQERGYVYAGTALIIQGTGLFQDPQKAGQFIAVLMTYFVILLAQDIIRIRLTRRLLWAAVILSFPALLMTVSRLAIVSGLMASVIGYIIFNRTSLVGRAILSMSAVLCMVIYFGFGQLELVKSILPDDLQKRFNVTGQSRDMRIRIWEDSWPIFVEHPWIGIGPGTYQEYQMVLEPQLRQYQKKGGFVPDQPENGYLKILYEGGAIGAAGFLLVLGAFFLRAARILTGQYPRELKARTWAVLSGGVVFLTTFTTLFTMSDPRNALLPLLLMAILFSSCLSADMRSDGVARSPRLGQDPESAIRDQRETRL